MKIENLLEIDKPQHFKLHAARKNEENKNPLDVFVRDKSEWLGWNAWFGKKHEFNRPYILSLIDFYPEKNIWLFGGIFHVHNYKSRPPASAQLSHAYDVELSDKASELIGRMKVSLTLSRGRSFLLENQIGKISLTEILRKRYSGPVFPGYDNVSLTFSELTSIVSNNRPDWKTALLNMKGVYLITLEDGRHYVGAAYGEIGLWNRWANYVITKDGGNKELSELNKETNGTYIERARFTLIEAWPMRTYDETILDREGYWKRALLSRSIGLNSN